MSMWSVQPRYCGFWMNDEDFFNPPTRRRYNPCHGRRNGHPLWSLVREQGSMSPVVFGKNNFEANLNVQHYTPEEISVKISENTITVEGKHEEKEDEHGFISRQFVRKYVLPKGHDIEKIESKLSSDGILTITAPKLNVEHRHIPVIQTGKPSKNTEEKKEEEEDDSNKME